MKVTDTQLTSGSFPITLADQTYLASPLSDRDYSTLDEYIQSRLINLARKAVENFPSNERGEVYQAAIKAAASSGFGTQEGSRIIGTTEGTIFLGWVMIRKQHKNVDLNTFTKLVQIDVEQALIQIYNAYTRLHNIDIEDDNKESSTEESKSE